MSTCEVCGEPGERQNDDKEVFCQYCWEDLLCAFCGNARKDTETVGERKACDGCSDEAKDLQAEQDAKQDREYRGMIRDQVAYYNQERGV